jgi:hypothetical protein
MQGRIETSDSQKCSPQSRPMRLVSFCVRGINPLNFASLIPLNGDLGTMGPYEHGDIFVTDGGAETDLD